MPQGCPTESHLRIAGCAELQRGLYIEGMACPARSLILLFGAVASVVGCAADGDGQQGGRSITTAPPESAEVGGAETTASGESSAAHGAPVDSHASPAERGVSGGGMNDAARVIALVLDRGDRVERVDAELKLHLTRADGAKAQLDATLKLGRPDRFRLRTTKWSFLVADVVVRGVDAQALLSPVVREHALETAQASFALGSVLGSLVGWYGGESEESAQRSTSTATERFEIIEERPDSIVVRVSKDKGTALEWTLARSDGRALQVRRFEADTITGVLGCSEHLDVDGVPLPTRLRFESTMGRIDVEVENLRINQSPDDRTPADRTFEPPVGAVRLGPVATTTNRSSSQRWPHLLASIQRSFHVELLA